ncbi:MAG: hypothetical protein ACOYNS_05055 [Bacteroidota bacterium]
MKKIFIAVIPFVLLLLSCKEESAVQPDSAVTTYTLRSADGRALPSFRYFLDLPGIDTGYIAVANEGSITVTRYASHPADDVFKVRFVYGYGLKYGSVMESTFKTYEKQLSYAAFTDTLYTGYFPLIKSGDSLVVNYPLKHDDRVDLNMSHTFRLVFR